MNKVKIVLVILLLFSLISNGFQFYLHSNEKNERIMFEKSLLMNEFSDRAEKWRNFNQFVQKLHEEDTNYPISKRQSDIYYELAKHEMSVIQKQTDSVVVFANTTNYKDYAQFINEFDRELETLVERFNRKLPLMTREQLVELSNGLEKSYNLYMNDAIGTFSTSENSVMFEPNVKELVKVIDELSSIRKRLEAIE